MRLKSLAIKGFKSFADETLINFNEDLIGIVGPNGSGKSNIVDAIRWVLGEQKTSELRLDSMSDVLFTGTKARKEGRVARVTLTFDNTKNILPTDYNEVSISRILYRNGSSEYRLNDVICRKKDIQSLFLDSGIGSNSYAIISLNMVEDILHDNGGSRRYMIEQAAGISKYKVRKKETLSKLRSTSEDLERVNDLLFEIQKNLSSFERQAKRTERYNKLKEQYKELAIVIAKQEIKSLSVALQQLRTQQTKESDEKLSIETQLKDAEAKLQKLKLKILEAEKSLSNDQQEFNRLIESLGQKENEKNLLNQQIVNGRERIRENGESLKQLSDVESSSTELLSAANKNKEQAQKQVSKIETTATKIQAELSRLQVIYQQLRDQEKKVKDQVAATQQRRSATERDIEHLRTKDNMLLADVERLEQRKVTMNTDSADKRHEQKKLAGQLDASEAKLLKLNVQVEDLDKIAQSMQDKIIDAQSAKSKIELEISSIKQRIKFLQNIIEKNEGASEAVRHLLKTEKDLVLFSDLVVVDDNKHTAIVELFFEPYLGHIVVSMEKRALALYDKVRQAQKGKVKIFALDKVPVAQRKSPPSSQLKPLRDILSYSKEHADLIEYLTDGTYIYEGGIDDMNWDELRHGDVILCSQDYLIYTVGEVYGGSNTLFEGVQLGRKKILEGLIEKQKQVDDSSNEQQRTIENLLKDKQANTAKLQYAKQDRKELSRAIDLQRQALYKLNSQLGSHDDNIAQIDKQIADKKEQVETIKVDLTAKVRQLEEINAVKMDALSDDELSRQLSASYEHINTQNQLKEAEQQKLYEAKNQYQIATKEQEFHTNRLRELESRRKTIISESSRVEKILAEGEQQTIKIKNELKALYEQREVLQAKLSEYEDTYYKEKGVIFEKEKEISDLRTKIHQKESLITMLNDKVAQRQFDLKAIHDRNEIEFGFRIKDVVVPAEYADAKVDTLKLNREKLQDKIRAFGDINPMAIEAYNEIKDRYEHITKEQNDILEAKESLEETIAEIESAASIQFHESLQQIKVNFKQVFQGLFSEDDDCDIVLLDTEDPLEAKIEIIAKPKGKRPKSISMLSGGEKTLTAASFLFALYLLKPAPFCIFDEVDAPLDDVNVLKFNEIIRRFSGDSQFIIITHNKLTMAEVDILYGVFLREQGVSGVSAVDFRDFDAAELEAIS